MYIYTYIYEIFKISKIRAATKFIRISPLWLAFCAMAFQRAIVVLGVWP